MLFAKCLIHFHPRGAFLEGSSCLHVTVLCGNSVCMVAFFLALFSLLRKRSFSWLIEYLLCRTDFFFHEECWDENR